MPIQYDMHMHSSFSTDSDASMESMVHAARQMGLKGICFTEHMDLDYPKQYFPDDPQAFAADPGQVYREIIRLRGTNYSQAGDPFYIGFGLEFGMQKHLAGTFHRIAQDYPLDFIVASQHLAGAMDPYYPEAWEGREPSDLIGQYYEEMLYNLKTMQEWDTLAHMDYIIRYIPGRNEPSGTAALSQTDIYDSLRHHADIIDEILRYVIENGKCLEVNTAGYKYGLGQPNPSPAILKRYRDLGGRRITIGADAHVPGQIAAAFGKVEPLLLSMGFDSYCVFEKRRMRKIQLPSISS